MITDLKTYPSDIIAFETSLRNHSAADIERLLREFDEQQRNVWGMRADADTK